MKLQYIVILSCSLFFMGCKETAKEVAKKEVLVTSAIQKTEAKSTYEDVDGNPIELVDYKGKRILLSYWATWCRPCIEEMPSLVEAQKILEDENYVFLMASDQSIKKINAFQAKKNFDLTFVKYNGALASEDITALPATFIYNEKGEKVDRIDGMTEWNSPEIIQKLKNIK